MLCDWGNKIYTTLSNKKIFPKYCDTQNFIIQIHYPSGYESIYSLISANCTIKLTLPIDIIDVPSTQFKAGDPISKYFHRYKDYL